MFKCYVTLWCLKLTNSHSIQRKIHFWLFGKKMISREIRKVALRDKSFREKVRQPSNLFPTSFFWFLLLPAANRFLSSILDFHFCNFCSIASLSRDKKKMKISKNFFYPIWAFWARFTPGSSARHPFFYVSFHFTQLEMRLLQGPD